MRCETAQAYCWRDRGFGMSREQLGRGALRGRGRVPPRDGCPVRCAAAGTRLQLRRGGCAGTLCPLLRTPARHGVQGPVPPPSSVLPANSIPPIRPL